MPMYYSHDIPSVNGMQCIEASPQSVNVSSSYAMVLPGVKPEAAQGQRGSVTMERLCV